MTQRNDRPVWMQFVLGVTFVVVGVLVLMSNLEFVDIGPIWEYWPLVIVVFGINKFRTARNASERRDGGWYVFVGLWLFVSLYDSFGLGIWKTWPVLVVVWGIDLLWRSTHSLHSERIERNAG
ncbi:MAG: hypothetical protein FJ215_01440 [Ignavibacteria bacterium]|nr:hypothetical protein [Ignavibacteria bacterium]